MANFCVFCVSLCAYLLLYFTTAAVCAADDYHHYTTDFQDDSYQYDIIMESLGHEGRLLQKRDAQIESNQSNVRNQSNSTSLRTASNDTSATQNQSTSNTDAVSLVNKTQTDNKLSSTKTKSGKRPKIAAIVNATSVDSFQKKLLGVNGTGQRKNITAKPTSLFNQTILRDLPLQNITLTKNDTDDDDDDDDLSIDSIPPDEDSEAFNRTLAAHHIINSTVDHHLYYNSTLRNDPEVGRFYWVDLQNYSDTKTSELLSSSHRRATTVQLSFDFPFYGRIVKNVTIATGGFLYTGDYVHSWLAATQYIAPLMANFDTSLSNDSYIRYLDNGTAFTVEWEKVSLQDKSTDGEFTFQTTLYKNGNIVFVYRNIPSFIKNVTDEHHFVKVGLSDAYIIDRTMFMVRRKTIYEYHRINFHKDNIRNWTVIYLTALPTCLQFEDCLTCVTNVIPSFQCYWCSRINRCSSGVDRNRQEWLTNHCETKPMDESFCPHTSGTNIFDKSNISYGHDLNEFKHQREGFSKSGHGYNNANALESNQPVRMGVSSIVAILFLIAMVAGLGLWVLYAYRNPHTTSGQILIRYRPSQWRWRRGEARYTAATIHM